MKHALLFILALLAAGAAFSQPGTLDPSFGDDGFSATTEFGYHNAIIPQPDGKLLTTGSYNRGGVIRFLPDGTLDSAFGTAGFFNPASGFTGYDLTLLSDNKILLVGISTDETHDIRSAVVRLLPDGRADSSFGVNGFVFPPAYKDYSGYFHLKVEGDGTTIISGRGQTNIQAIVPEYSFLSRLSPEGAFDASWGENGRIFNYDIIGERALSLQEDGKILLGGYNAISGIGEDNFTISRYNEDGTIDAGFGNNGTVSTDGLGSIDELTGIVVQPDGKIVAGGYSGELVGGLYKMSAFRYLPNGSPDASFGNEGKAFVAFGNLVANSQSTLLQGDGKIILAGVTKPNKPSGQSSIALCRLTASGTIDSSFAVDGRNVTPYLNYDAEGLCATLQKDGKIVVGGEYYNAGKGYDNYLLARYNNDVTSRRQIIVTRIKRYLQHHGITWQTDNNVRYYTVQRSVDGGVTYQPVAKLYNNHQSSLSYEEATTNDNTMYRVAATAKDGSRSLSNSLLLSNEASVKLFPNPVRSTLQVQGLPTDSKTNITVTDFSGNVRNSTTSNGGSVSIIASTLKPGNYLLKVQSGGETTTKTFVKE